MTVSNTTSVVQYTGNGVTVNWPTGYRFFRNTDLVLTKRSSSGVTTLLTLNTDYSVSGADAPQGGTVTTTSPIGAGELLTVARVLTAQQLTDLRNQGNYFAEIHEDVFDYLTMLIQQTGESDSRALRHPRESEHYQAEARRIVDLEDPVDAQDAATKNWVGKFIDSVSGLINNTLGIAYDGGNLFDYLKTGVSRTVDTIAALQALSTTRNQRAFVLGFYDRLDGGGGQYFTDGVDTTTPLIPGVVVAGAGGVRWFLHIEGAVSLKQFGARGTWNGTTGADDTVAIQAAARSGLRDIYVPSLPAPFAFQTTAKITTDQSVRFHGPGVEPYSALGVSASNTASTRGRGAWFHFNHPGIGFEVKRSAGFTGVMFEGIGTFRTHTIPAGATPFTPAVYEPDFLLDDAGDTWFKNVCTLNPYHAIKVQNGQQGRVWIDGVYGQPLFKGTEVIESYDVLRVENVHWWPYWAPVQKVYDYQLANTKAFTSFRSDNPVYDKCFSIFHQIGLTIAGNAFGTTNKLKTSNMDLDRCAYGMIVQATAIGHTAQHTSFTTQGETGYTLADNIGALILADSCDIDFANVDVRNVRGNGIRVDGQFCRIGIVNPNITEWNLKNTGFAAIEVAVNSTVDVAGSPKYRATNTSLIYSGAGKIRAILAASNFGGSTNASGDVTITHGGLGLPNRVSIQMTSTASIACSVTAKSTTNFTVRFYNTSTGAALASTAVAFDWQCSMA